VSKPAIQLHHLRKTFGRRYVVDGLDLEVAPGTIVGLLGHNGAGKSTTMRMIVGLLPPSEGRVEICGVDVFARPLEARRHFGAVPEEPALYGWLTAREHLEFVMQVRGGADRDQVEEALDLTGLGEDADRPIREYSQGMRRKTAIAVAMIGRPPVLILDEALNGLDPPSAIRVEAALRKRVDDGAAILFSSHVLESILRFGDRLVVMKRGVVATDTPTTDVDPEALVGLLERSA
jgi:ABC-2 type transport system ATP-binding protein